MFQTNRIQDNIFVNTFKSIGAQSNIEKSKCKIIVIILLFDGDNCESHSLRGATYLSSLYLLCIKTQSFWQR